METRRVVITGMGAVTPLGNSVQAFWQGLREGRNGIAPITKVDVSDSAVKLAGEVHGFDPRDIKIWDYKIIIIYLRIRHQLVLGIIIFLII